MLFYIRIDYSDDNDIFFCEQVRSINAVRLIFSKWTLKLSPQWQENLIKFLENQVFWNILDSGHWKKRNLRKFCKNKMKLYWQT